MLKNLFLILCISLYTQASIKDIEKKITNNNKKISRINDDKQSVNKSIDILASQIKKEEEKYDEIVKKLELTNNNIILNRLKLKNAKNNLEQLKKDAVKLQKKKEKIEQSVIDFIVEKYAMSMGIEQTERTSLKQVIDKEVYTLILENAKQEVLDLNIDYLKVNREKRSNEDKTKKLLKYVAKQEEIKKEFASMQKEQEKTIESLRGKHKLYQSKLKQIIRKQSKIKDLLGSLNILKKKEIQKEKERIAKEKARLKKQKELARKKELAKQKLKEKTKKSKQMKIVSKKELDDDIDIEVRKLGSSAKGIKVSKYYGEKTIAPLKSYDVTKKFGKYYDKVYKMKLFNESVSLKTKIPNAKVFNVLRGQVVYAKQNSGLLENVVIVKHKNNLHTIYSHLDKISPNLKVGKWIKKGYVVGRINDTLMFQATKNSKYIDPLQLIK
jgi:murein DD-endopeptidase MepM/ murein hydrolase activator NlpD